MDFAFTEDQLAIKDSVGKLCAEFDGSYWLKKDKEGGFPEDFYRAMADAGWLGITMPPEYGGAGMGVTEACIMMHEVASHGGAMAASSTVHINLFGPHPIVVFGTEIPGLTPAERWAQQWAAHAGDTHPPTASAPSGQSNWLTVLGVIGALMVGATVLMATKPLAPTAKEAAAMETLSGASMMATMSCSPMAK